MIWYKGGGNFENQKNFLNQFFNHFIGTFYGRKCLNIFSANQCEINSIYLI